MAIYLVTGKLGSGKSLACVGRMRDALIDGRRIATNIDVKLEVLFPRRPRGRNVVRLPDKPSVFDLEALGVGNASYDETKNGIIILDELATWLNSREWADKARQPVIDWLVHSRKHGWDVMFIAQDASQIDRQVRQALVEYLVVCRRLDRLRMPIIGPILQSLTLGFYDGRLPRVHIAAVRYGTEAHAMVAERWVYMGNELFAAYNTRQIFSDGYEDGPFSVLAANYFAAPGIGLLERVRRCWRKDRNPVTRTRVVKPHPLRVLLEKLPAEDRIRHFQRLERLGAFR